MLQGVKQLDSIIVKPIGKCINDLHFMSIGNASQLGLTSESKPAYANPLHIYPLMGSYHTEHVYICSYKNCHLLHVVHAGIFMCVCM